MKNLTTSIEQRDEIVAKLGGHAAVRNLARKVLGKQIEAGREAGTYEEVADRLRAAAALAEALASADDVVDGTHELSFDGRTRIGAPAERLPRHDREVYAARMLVWALDSSGEVVRSYLADALDSVSDSERDPFDAFAVADLEAKGVDPAKAAEVVANTYGDPR